MDLDIVRIECSLELEKGGRTPAPVLYAALHSFKGVFKKLSCASPEGICVDCSFNSDCTFHAVFSQELSHNRETVKRHQKPSLPFSFYIREIDANIHTSTIGMVVIGSAIFHFDKFCIALGDVINNSLDLLSGGERFSLRFYSIDTAGGKYEYSSLHDLQQNIVILSGRQILHGVYLSDRFAISFFSPLRLMAYGSVARNFDFALFFRSQLRRVSSFFAYYGSGELDIDYPSLSLAADDLLIMESTVAYTWPLTNSAHHYAGLTGKVECSVSEQDILSILQLGSYFNAGKGAAYGAGFHQIEIL